MKDLGIAVKAERWMSISGLRVGRRFLKNLKDVVRSRPNGSGVRLQRRTYVDFIHNGNRKYIFTVTIQNGDMLNGQSEGPVLPTKSEIDL